MKVNVKQREGDEVVCSVSATASEVNSAFRQAAEQFAAQMGIPPNASMAPEDAIAAQLGVKDVDSMLAGRVSEALVPKALDKKGLTPAFQPEVSAEGLPTRGHEYRFTMKVTTKPEYELSSYDPVTIKVVPFVIDESAVDAELASMAKEYTSYVASSSSESGTAIEHGDYLRLNMNAFDSKGEALSGLTADGRIYQLGSGNMPEGFERELSEMKVGEERTFSFDAPIASEDGDASSSKIDVTVTVVEILEESKPEINDAWIKVHMPMFGSLEELRAQIAKSIEIQDRQNYESYLRQTAVQKMAERFEGHIADAVYESMMSSMTDQLKSQAASQGMSWEEFVESNGGDQQLTMLIMMQVRETLVQGFTLDAVFRHFKLTVNDSDLYDVCRMLNPQVDPKALLAQVKEHGEMFALRESAERYKANQYILDNATIEYLEES